MQKAVVTLWLCFNGLLSFAQEKLPRKYLAPNASSPITIDGKANGKEWKKAKWSDAFVDIEGDRKPKPTYRTRVKMQWDDQFLYILAKLEEPHLWATLTQRDAIIFQDHDFEVFIDPDNDSQEYTEIEINALGTVMDLFMTRSYKKGGPMDLTWNVKNLQSAVHLKGTLNKNNDHDRYWIVEMAIPVASLSKTGKMYTPTAGGFWRINFSRVQWLIDPDGTSYKKRLNEKGKRIPEQNWVWSPQGLIDMHVPEKWGYVYFIR